MKTWIRKTLWGIGGLFAAICLFWRIRPVSYSYEYDELFTAITSDPSVPLGYIWNAFLRPDVHPPLHNLLLYVWNYFVPFGPEFWLRLPSQFFGLLALVFAWFMFPKRLGKTARGIFFIMMACHSAAIFYTQHARAYALMLCLAVPMTFWFLDFSHRIAKNNLISASRWTIWGLNGLLLCWSHYFGALLFGVFSILLFAQAVYYKRRLFAFILVPVCSFALFMPWLLPNLWANISLDRFDGTWWANATPLRYIMPELVAFFFSSSIGHWIMSGLVLWALWQIYQCYKTQKSVPYSREIILLALVICMVFGAALVMLLKIFLFFGRYFMGLVPAIYLLCALLLAPLVRKKLLALFLFILFVAFALNGYAVQYVMSQYSLLFSARATAEMYRDLYQGKELYAVALEGFPPASMKPMYEFYLNKVFGLNVNVTELYQLPADEREKLLTQREKAVIWMPNCNTEKLVRLAQEWDRSIGIENKIGTSCFLQLSEPGVHGITDEWKEKYKPQKIGAILR